MGAYRPAAYATSSTSTSANTFAATLTPRNKSTARATISASPLRPPDEIGYYCIATSSNKVNTKTIHFSIADKHSIDNQRFEVTCFRHVWYSNSKEGQLRLRQQQYLHQREGTTSTAGATSATTRTAIACTAIATRTTATTPTIYKHLHRIQLTSAILSWQLHHVLQLHPVPGLYRCLESHQLLDYRSYCAFYIYYDNERAIIVITADHGSNNLQPQQRLQQGIKLYWRLLQHYDIGTPTHSAIPTHGKYIRIFFFLSYHSRTRRKKHRRLLVLQRPLSDTAANVFIKHMANGSFTTVWTS